MTSSGSAKRTSWPVRILGPAAARAWRIVGAPWVRRVASIVFFALALWLIWQQVAQISLADFLDALASTSWAVIGLSIGLTLCSYLCLSGTEWLALRALGHPLPYRAAAQVAIPAYALTNSAGFSPATGTLMRVSLYARRGLTAAQSAQVAMVAGAAVTLSGLVAGGVSLVMRTRVFARLAHVPYGLVTAAGIVLLLPALIWFVAFSQRAPAWLGRSRSGPRPAERLLGLSAGLGDWLFSCAALFALFPHAHWGVFPGFLGVYVASSVLSAASGVPGGIGVFEAIMLTLSSIAAHAHETAAALLLYRAIYSLGPFAITTTLGAVRRVGRRRQPSPTSSRRNSA